MTEQTSDIAEFLQLSSISIVRKIAEALYHKLLLHARDNLREKVAHTYKTALEYVLRHFVLRNIRNISIRHTTLIFNVLL